MLSQRDASQRPVEGLNRMARRQSFLKSSMQVAMSDAVFGFFDTRILMCYNSDKAGWLGEVAGNQSGTVVRLRAP